MPPSCGLGIRVEPAGRITLLHQARRTHSGIKNRVVTRTALWCRTLDVFSLPALALPPAACGKAEAEQRQAGGFWNRRGRCTRDAGDAGERDRAGVGGGGAVER